MALDTMTQRCARLLWEGYKAAGEKEVVQLHGTVADDAKMPAGTPVHHACTHQLEYAIGAVVEEPRAGGDGRLHALQDHRSWFRVAARGGLPP